MAEQLCPVCGCTVDENSYEKDGVLYCCESCASGGPCECGCCAVVEKEPEE
ncbi:MAG: hypothetical protein MUO17_05780 [Dehalococcoidales bacterium]|jgi:hypothetical protein|nr:hypothetical protein [Dehalococcoidales bacterium]